MNDIYKHFLTTPFVESMAKCHHFFQKKDGTSIPNPHHLEDDVWTHTKMVYVITEAIPSCFPIREDLKVLALLHDIGKPLMRAQTEEAITETPKTRFFGHEFASACMAVNFLKKHYSGEKLIKMLHVVALHLVRDRECVKIKEYTTDAETLRLHLGLSMCDTFGRISDDHYKAEYSDIPAMFANIKDEPMPVVDIAGKQTLTIMIGIPGSGKSTIAPKFGKVFSPDAKLLSLFPASSYNKSFALAKASGINWTEQAFLDLEKHVKTGENVVWDATNMTRKKRVAFVSRARRLGLAIRIIIIWRDLADCISCRSGDKAIPMDVFKSMIGSFSFPKRDEFDVLENVVI